MSCGHRMVITPSIVRPPPLQIVQEERYHVCRPYPQQDAGDDLHSPRRMTGAEPRGGSGGAMGGRAAATVVS